MPYYKKRVGHIWNKVQLICVFLYLPKKEKKTVKKFRWLIVGLAALLFTTMIVINVGAKQIMMDEGCEEDGSCCVDENNCACG
jgi:hypothetical protein